MKTNIITGIICVLLFACSGGGKQAQLEKLKKEHDKISDQIKQLEEEIAKDKTLDSTKIVNVEFTTVKPQEFSHYIEVQGKVDGEDNVGVSPKSMGVVNEIFVKEGDAVKKGQVLAQIDDAVMRQSLNEVQTQLDFATSLYNKQKTLWDQKIGSEVQYLNAKTNKEALERRKSTLIDQIDMSKIKSPINGTVEDIPIKIGQSVAPGLPVFKVINFSKINVFADVAEAYSAKIKKGDEVIVAFPDLQTEVKATLDFSSKFISPVNRTFAIKIKLDGNKIDYRANMIAIIKIRDYFNPKSIVLPINSIQNESAGKFVYVVKEDKGKKTARKQQIKTGQSYNGLVEVTEGITENDKLITTGYQMLEDGSLIKF